ncbi:MAG: TetR/AcrR family transcriptional regulator [Pseudorhodobacter sp.]|nr:TetR/AcrR family transcriptional regulator [Pseudorhodobacter sp.]
MDKPLRLTLIDAGLALLEEGGMAALTLRRTAARAGVSHAAPAHHFDGLPGLLTAMAARAFELFAASLQSDDSLPPRDHLLAVCHGYLAFARAHKGLFHLMFVSPQVDRADPAVTPHANCAYLTLRAACLPFAAPGASEDTLLETAVWSLVHGYAALGFDPAADPRTRFTPPPPFDALLDELLKGRQTYRPAPSFTIVHG